MLKMNGYFDVKVKSLAAVLIAVLACGCNHSSKQQVWSFEADALQTVPHGWKVAETNSSNHPAVWKVICADQAAVGRQVLAITETTNTKNTYNLLINDQVNLADVLITVQVKSNTGIEDQGGGPIWRAIDADNYYIARWNPLENNFRVYYVKNGQRKQLASADVNLDSDQWLEISIRHIDDMIEAFLNGQKLIDVQDTTFTEPGNIGLWTKADAATFFDRVTVEPAQ